MVSLLVFYLPLKICTNKYEQTLDCKNNIFYGYIYRQISQTPREKKLLIKIKINIPHSFILLCSLRFPYFTLK